jgi:putative transcription factor
VKKKDHTNKATLEGRKVAEVLNDEDTFTVPTVSHDFKIALMQARNAKGLTQEKLAMLVNEKKTVIQDYEAGKAVP